MTEKINHTIIVPVDLAGLRLDTALTKLLPNYSRTQIQHWIKNHSVVIDNQQPKAKQIIRGGETIFIHAQLKEQPAWDPEDIPLNIIYEDESLLIINKPPGMVVHPGAGNIHQTLLNALLHHAPQLQTLPRAGILHRLDKDTSGLLVVAKTHASLRKLSQQLKNKSLIRIYQAVVCGVLIGGGKVDAAIGRHSIQRKKMAVVEEGKPAVTHYRILERFPAYTLLKIQLETGRTHQIRVHMAHIRHPVFGDPVYGGRLSLPKGASAELIQMLRQFKRQALHACELGLTHPESGKTMTFKAPLPKDMQKLINQLKK